MMEKGKILLTMSLIVLMAASFVSLGCSRGEKIDKIRIGSTAPGHLKFVVSRHLGFFDKAFEADGIKIEYYPFNEGGSAVITALANGSLDITYTGADPTLRAGAAGADIYLVALSSSNPSSEQGILVAANSPIQTVPDLKGKKIAFLTGTMRHARLVRALKDAGLSINDVEPMNLPFSASGPALLRGDIDALVEGETTVAPLVQTGEARLLILDSSEWVAPSSAISVSGEFLRKHRNVLKKFLEVDREISNWVDANYEKTIEIFADGTGQDREATARAYPHKKFYQDPYLTDSSIEAFKTEAEFLKDAGLADDVADFDKWVKREVIDEIYKNGK